MKRLITITFLLNVIMNFTVYSQSGVTATTGFQIKGKKGAASVTIGLPVYNSSTNIKNKTNFGIQQSFISSPTSISRDFSSNSKLTLYPNPVRDRIFLTDITATEFPSHFVISNILGGVLLSGILDMSHKSVEVSDIPNGFYIFSLMKGNNNIYSQLFIKD